MLNFKLKVKVISKPSGYIQSGNSTNSNAFISRKVIKASLEDAGNVSTIAKCLDEESERTLTVCS